jgi:hypothetical protein
MQLSVPEVTDLSSEPAHVLAEYGADDPQNKIKAGFARNYLLARRLLERGVRFVQLFNGAYAMGEGVGRLHELRGQPAAVSQDGRDRRQSQSGTVLL